MTIIAISKESWIEQLDLKEQDKFLELVDAMVIVGDCETSAQPPYYFVNGDYDEVFHFMKKLALCKAYSQKTLFSSNYSLVEIKEGMTASDLRKEWVYELQCRNLV